LIAAQDTVVVMADTTRFASACRHHSRMLGLGMLLAACAMPSIRVADLATSRVIEPPAHMAFSTNGKWLDVSPDGRALAVVVNQPTGESILWVDDLKSTKSFPLAGTEGATSPFWSPDSRVLGFFAQGQLRLIDVISGRRRTLCACGSPFGAAWSREGVIVLSQKTGLWQIPAAGGSPSALTHLDPTREEVVHAWPQFLPDGRHFLYRLRSRVERYTGIFVGSLEPGRRPRRLIGTDSSPMYSDGHLFFGRDGTLYAQALDLVHVRLTGEPVRVATSVMHNSQSGQVSAAVSDSGLLVYRSITLQRLMWLDRDGHELGSLGPPGVYFDPAVSPQGDSVAVSRLDPQTSMEHIWILDATRGTGTRLTADRVHERAPVFAPDGRHLVFRSNQDRDGRWVLYEKALGDSNTGQRLPLVGVPSHWSHDGRFLVVDAYRPSDTKWNLSVLPMRGAGHPFTIATPAFNEIHGHLSPDDRWMTYESNETGTFNVLVRPFPSGDGIWPVSTEGGINPRWRADGQELFYVAPDGQLMSVEVHAGREFTMDRPRALFNTGLSWHTGVTGRNQYDVTANGEKFLLIQPATGSDSSVLTVVGSWREALRP
jgi:Tol biopolymer transport system component